jgi:tRNA (mo5U34)-methyltransferase
MPQTRLSSILTYHAPDPLDTIATPEQIDRDVLIALRNERMDSLWSERLAPQRDALQTLIQHIPDTVSHELHAPVVRIGHKEDIPDQHHGAIRTALEAFCPWKKGPFSYFGHEIDAEWRSDWKWERIEPHISSLRDRRVADIGCHNGYFMLRMAAHQPKCVIGIEPVPQHFWNFQILQQAVQLDSLSFELFGVEHMKHFHGFFDTIFCLGILYHHIDPIGLLREMRQSLAPGGEIVVDCQGIPGDLPMALTPRKRYAGARGVWFVPTRSCLENWIIRAGFNAVTCIYEAPLSTEEQRRTEWAQVDSLREFLQPDDINHTIEGYPAPHRFYFKAKK